MIRYLLQFINNLFLTHINKRHDDAIHNEARGRPVGLANSYRKTHKSILLRETFFAHLGRIGVSHKNVSQILAIIDFFKQRNYRKNFVSKEEYYR